MKILFLLSCLEPAGSETYCLSLAGAWKGKHEIHWISDRLHYNQTYLSMPIHQKAFPGGLLNTWRVASYLRSERIQLVHSHSRRAHWVAAQAARIAGIPHVTTIHQPPPVHFFSKLFPCFGDQTIAIDEVVAQHLTSRFNVSSGKVHLIRNGIDVSHLAPTVRQPLNIKQVLMIGRLTGGRWAAFQFFLKSLERIASTLPPVHYKIVGHVPDERREALTSQLSILNAKIYPSTVQPLGYVKELEVLVRNSDGAIAAGRSALECLAQGRPVLLLGEGGVLGVCRPEIWTQALRTNLGDHITPKDFDQPKFERALRDIVTLNAQQQDLNRWAREQIEKNFQLKTVAAQVEAVYHKALHP